MPVLPQEEKAGSSMSFLPILGTVRGMLTISDLTDQVAKESKDSTASDHPIHDTAKAEHHQANPGPVISQTLGEPTSKEENRKKAEEMNK